MNRRILFTFAVVALAAIVAAPNATADCGSPQAVSSVYSDFGQDHPLNFTNIGPDAGWQTLSDASVVGRFWDGANSLNVNSFGVGSDCPVDYFVIKTDFAPAWGFLGYNGGASGSTPRCVNVGGCLAFGTSMSVLFETTTQNGQGAAFVASRVKNSADPVAFPGGPPSSNDYDFARGQADLNLVAATKPAVVSSARCNDNANFVCLSLRYGGHNAGFIPIDGFSGNNSIAGFKLLEATGAADPGRARGNWPSSPKQLDANAGDPTTLAEVRIDCTNPDVKHWLGVQMVFEGGAADVDGTYVGEAISVQCNATAANPPKFKQISKPKVVRGE